MKNIFMSIAMCFSLSAYSQSAPCNPAVEECLAGGVEHNMPEESEIIANIELALQDLGIAFNEIQIERNFRSGTRAFAENLASSFSFSRIQKYDSAEVTIKNGPIKIECILDVTSTISQGEQSNQINLRNCSISNEAIAIPSGHMSSKYLMMEQL